MRRSIADLRVLIVPGLHGSGPDHWQTRWQQRYPSFERVEQAKWDTPELPVWSDRLDQVLRMSNRPTVIVAHSFGCLTAVHRAGSLASSRLAGMLLVAPADPDKFGVAQELLEVKLSCPSVVVGSSNDPWMGAHQAAHWAQVWGSEFINAGAVGHVNSESRLGDWLFGLLLLQRLAVTADAQPSVPA